VTGSDFWDKRRDEAVQESCVRGPSDSRRLCFCRNAGSQSALAGKVARAWCVPRALEASVSRDACVPRAREARVSRERRVPRALERNVSRARCVPRALGRIVSRGRRPPRAVEDGVARSRVGAWSGIEVRASQSSQLPVFILFYRSDRSYRALLPQPTAWIILCQTQVRHEILPSCKLESRSLDKNQPFRATISWSYRL
jgi:hypothetical protein